MWSNLSQPCFINYLNYKVEFEYRNMPKIHVISLYLKFPAATCRNVFVVWIFLDSPH